MGQDLSKEKERMVRGLVQEGLLKSPGVISAVGRVPRELFVPEHLRRYAYDDKPLPTEHGQTISAPHGMICRALHDRHNE
jgi:protein-L-isoaspartate(D-aspartate) O-methyltransferase